MIYQGGPGRGWPHGDAARPIPYTVFTRRRAMFWVLVVVLAVGLTTCGNAGNTASSARPQGPSLPTHHDAAGAGSARKFLIA